MSGLPIFPATNFTPVIAAYATGNPVILPALVYFDFLSEPAALWGGHYDFRTGGVVWKGLGRSGLLIGIEGVSVTSSAQSSDMTFTLSGADSGLLSVFAGVDRSEYVGRLCAVYGQFCTPDWQPVTDGGGNPVPPFAYSAGIMNTAPVSRVPNDKGGFTATISLPASNIFAGRSIARNSYYTDPDQQRRYPGDLFCSFVQSIQETSIQQPWR